MCEDAIQSGGIAVTAFHCFSLAITDSVRLPNRSVLSTPRGRLAYAAERRGFWLTDFCEFYTSVFLITSGRATIAGRPAALLCEVKTKITSHEVGVNVCWSLEWGRCGFLSLALRA